MHHKQIYVKLKAIKGEGMTNLQILNNILLSDQVCEKFYRELKNNPDFRLWLKEILPEIEKCKMPQNNPWHIYNVLDHILHSVEEMNRLSYSMDVKTQLILAQTMFLHDIGKPQCHLKRKRGNKMIDSFFYHNEASAYIANRVLPKLGVDGKNKALITALVFKHDIFMFIDKNKATNPYHETLSPNLIKEHMTFFEKCGLNGYDCIEKLLLVGKADALAQNPKKSKDTLELIDLMTEMLTSMQHERC